VLARHEQPEGRGIDVTGRFGLARNQPVALFRQHPLAAPEAHAGPGVERAVEHHAVRQPCLDRRGGLRDRTAAVDATELGFAVIAQRGQAERVHDRCLGRVVPGVAHQTVDIVDLEPRILERAEDGL